MAVVLLFKVGDAGEPAEGSHHGVLSCPAIPPSSDYKPGDALFTIRFYISAGSKITNKGVIWTDVPHGPGTAFKRDKFHGHRIKNSIYKDSSVDIDIYKPGVYSYYVSYQSINEDRDCSNVNGGEELTTTKKFYFVVPPSLFINGEYLPLNAISLQSMISKWMGTELDTQWEDIFKDVAQKGYNMIHFTPLQERGESNSPYSILDQLEFDSKVFKNGVDDVKKMVKNLETKHGILSMTDVVLNHTANNSPWLRDHPDAGYNQVTAPHLNAAMELDKLLLHFSKYMKSHGYSTIISNVQDLLKVMDGIKIHVLGELKLWQYYVVNVAEHMKTLESQWAEDLPPMEKDLEIPNEYKASLQKIATYVTENCVDSPFGLSVRNGNKVVISKFIGVLRFIYGADAKFEDIKDDAKKILDEVNLPLYRAYDDDNSEILEQLYNRIKYQRLEEHGPKMGEVTEESPLTEPYFTRFTGTDGKEWSLANNGWIWGGNPLVDFASSESRCYLRREVIVWGDCVKLRYGSGPEDSPFLWDHMLSYCKLLASLFHGFRIDNCHSTPLHVGEALLDAAREVNPNLYVVAELFSGSETLDILFVERLGISSLIREAMQAYSVGELSRLVHRHGGRPIGSFRTLPLDSIAYPADKNVFSKQSNENINNRSELPIPETIRSQDPHALFMDCTHDNEMPAEKRTIEDTLPNAALVSFCSCATGTTFGYDECYPHLLNVVTEKRLYTYGDNGIGEVKKKLNEIRNEIANQSLDDMEKNEVHVHHEGQFVTVHRTNAKSGKGYFLIARTKFYGDGDQSMAPITLSGTTVKFEFAYTLIRKGDAPESDSTIESIPVELEALPEFDIYYDDENEYGVINLPQDFPQGSIAVFSTNVEGCDDELDKFIRTGALEAAQKLNLLDINSILYRCESEERDASAGTDGVYNIPDYGHLVYAGIQGWISVLRDVIKNNDLSHPLAEHLRQGSWACDFIHNRLNKYNKSEGILEFQNWLVSRCERIKSVPYFLRPRYFAFIVGIAYEALRHKALSLMNIQIQNSTLFVQNLAMTSIQMVSVMRSASVNPFEQVPSMAAGLPHFSYDFMRCWGRDVFISVRGLLIATGRYDEAKSHILNFAMTLKHGLIPNLLGSGREPRYNARDAAWFFLECIQSYIKIVPGGEEILDCKIKRRFPLDDTYIPFNDPQAYSYESSIREIYYEILSRHAGGIKYREANAGPNLDSQMKDEGFNVEVFVDWETGLIHGGSQFNCGTWMDKMGESTKAGSKGVPGTPRDGAAIEINGMLKSALRFAGELNEKGLFPYTSVKTQEGKEITLKEWDQLIQDNFEKCYYIPLDPADDHKYNLDSSIVNRRGIYKDLYKSGKPYEDYQLRGNFPIAMVVAPELFDMEHALHCVEFADKVMRGPIGFKTLDPSDFNYRPYYNNSEDSTDFATSKGRNYHQGPEWCWINGYFLRAYHLINFKQHPACQSEKGEPTQHLHQLISSRLIHLKEWIRDSHWAGLTELTNKDGSLCNDSSPTQAWSASCLLDLYFDIWNMEQLE